MPGQARAERRTSTRGRHRRGLLITAAAELVMEQGFAAVGHRSVAERAGVPLSATTYYFASLEDLLREAVEALAADWSAAARETLDRLPARLAEPAQVAAALLDVVVFGPAGGADATPGGPLTLYDRYLEAARHPHLRTTIAGYDDHLDGLVVDVLRRAGLPHDRESARLAVAVVDGALVRAFAEGRDPGTTLPQVEQVLRLLEAVTPEEV